MFFTQTTGNALTFFDYKTEQFTAYQVPTPLALPVGVYVPEDGSVWICEFGGQKIARFNFTDATWKEYPVPLLGGLGPAVMRAETEGRYLWYTAFIGNSVGRVDMFTGEMKAFTNPSPLSFPTEDTVDSEGNVWFSTATQNTLNKLIPSTGEIQTFEQPDTIVTAPVSLPLAADIAVHYGPGNAIWFTEVANNRVGRFQL
jgi:streptogramin lyase